MVGVAHTQNIIGHRRSLSETLHSSLLIFHFKKVIGGAYPFKKYSFVNYIQKGIKKSPVPFARNGGMR